MSNRSCVLTFDGVKGEDLKIYRDEDTRTYRLFVTQHGRSLENCDVTADQFKTLAERLTAIASSHDPWIDYED